MTKKSCLIYVADKAMGEMLKGFFSRQNFHLSLDSGSFAIDPDNDIKVASGLHDPGLYSKAEGLMQPFAKDYEHVMIILDAAWDGSPGGEKIISHINTQLEKAGWTADKRQTIVIDPELENWVWQDSTHVCNALGYSGQFAALRNELQTNALWPQNCTKPPDPKEAMLWVLKKTDKKMSSSIFSSIAQAISIARCTDTAFQSFLSTLRKWFPKETT